MASAANIYISSLGTPSISSGGYGVNYGTQLTGAIHELFAAVSPSQALNGYTDYRLLMIANNHATDELDGLKIYVSAQTTSANTELYLAVAPGLFNAQSPAYNDGSPIPSIASVTSVPSGVTFYAAADLASALSLGTLGSGGSSTTSRNARFVWVKRVVTAGAGALSSDFGTITVTNRV